MPTQADDAPTTTATPSPWMTVPEAADRAKCGTQMIYSAIRSGRLKAARLGARNDLRIHESWLDAWVVAALVVVNPDAPGAAVPLSFQKKRR